MDIETRTPLNTNLVIERIEEMRNNREYDDLSVIAGMGDLWDACRRYLMAFQVDVLNGMAPAGVVDLDTLEPTDWDELVRHQLAVMGRKYGYENVTAVVHGVEYKVVVEQATENK